MELLELEAPVDETAGADDETPAAVLDWRTELDC